MIVSHACRYLEEGLCKQRELTVQRLSDRSMTVCSGNCKSSWEVKFCGGKGVGGWCGELQVIRSEKHSRLTTEGLSGQGSDSEWNGTHRRLWTWHRLCFKRLWLLCWDSPGVGKSRRKETSQEAAIPGRDDAGSHKDDSNGGGGKCWISGNSLKAETGELWFQDRLWGERDKEDSRMTSACWA